MKAPLIFCSTSHSINVQKIFKIVLSKVSLLFSLQSRCEPSEPFPITELTSRLDGFRRLTSSARFQKSPKSVNLFYSTSILSRPFHQHQSHTSTLAWIGRRPGYRRHPCRSPRPLSCRSRALSSRISIPRVSSPHTFPSFVLGPWSSILNRPSQNPQRIPNLSLSPRYDFVVFLLIPFLLCNFLSAPAIGHFGNTFG